MTVRQLRWLLLVAVSSCTGLTSGNTPVAIEFVSPVPSVVHVDSTATLRVLVRDRDGAIVSAPIRALSLDTAFLTVDSLGAGDSTVRFLLKGVKTDSGKSVQVHVVATSGTLQSIPLAITVDSL